MNAVTKTKPRNFYILSKSIPEGGRCLTMHEQQRLAPPYACGERWFIEPLPGRNDIGCLLTWGSEGALDGTLLAFSVDFGRTF
jgi:hypothetical protein